MQAVHFFSFSLFSVIQKHHLIRHGTEQNSSRMKKRKYITKWKWNMGKSRWWSTRGHKESSERAPCTYTHIMRFQAFLHFFRKKKKKTTWLHSEFGFFLLTYFFEFAEEMSWWCSLENLNKEEKNEIESDKRVMQMKEKQSFWLKRSIPPIYMNDSCIYKYAYGLMSL